MGTDLTKQQIPEAFLCWALLEVAVKSVPASWWGPLASPRARREGRREHHPSRKSFLTRRHGGRADMFDRATMRSSPVLCGSPIPSGRVSHRILAERDPDMRCDSLRLAPVTHLASSRLRSSLFQLHHYVLTYVCGHGSECALYLVRRFRTRNDDDMRPLSQHPR